MITKKPILVLTLITLFIFAAFKTNTNLSEKVIRAFTDYKKHYYLQIVFLHHDKSEYHVGETIWMKGYLLSAENLSFDKHSKNLYVDLIDLHGDVIREKILLLENGKGDGYLQLDDSIPHGYYRLRAYTNWMLNFNLTEIPEHLLHIQNLEYMIGHPDDKRLAKKLRRKKQKDHNAIFPGRG